MFRDRRHAGEELAAVVRDRFARDAPPAPVLVLGIARGGVPVAAPVAAALAAPLDVLVVRKVGAPGNPEYGLGAVDARGEGVVDRERAYQAGASDAVLEAATARAVEEAGRLEVELRGDRPFVVQGRAVVVVDDGVATGGTLAAACEILRRTGAAWLMAAAPVATPPAIAALALLADAVATVSAPMRFGAVGEFYADFRQVDADAVRRLLRSAAA